MARGANSRALPGEIKGVKHMKPTPIAQILRRIRPLARQHQVAHLCGIIATEPRRSIRRQELEAALKDVINKQLRKENREDAA